MITNTGKDIIAKYLIGQAPSYASYLAVGCGAKPLGALDSLGDYSTKQNLDFEMFRVPITSRGYVTEIVNDVEVSKVVLTAELPSEQKYEISEIGIFSAKSNPAAAGRDSRIVYTFNESENWEYHSETSSSDISTVYTLYTGNTNNGNIEVDPTLYPVFRTNSDNVVFSNMNRVQRQEPGRFLNSLMMIPGDMSELVVDGDGVMSVKPKDTNGYYANHIHLSSSNLDLNTNSPSDELRIAFSVINKTANSSAVPSRARIMVEFASDEVSATANYARFQAETSLLSTNRYHVVSQKLSELTKSSGFSWHQVNLVKVYVSVYELSGGVDVLSDNYYVGLDAMRFENVTAQNPLYGMTGYSVTKVADVDGKPISKLANSSNMIEFRYGLGVN